MKKIYFYSFLIMTGVWLSSCDADEVDCVDFGVTLSNDIQEIFAGEPVTFDFSGNPDYIVFYSGEDGSKYANKDRLRVEIESAELSYEILQQYTRVPYRNKETMSIFISESFNGDYSTIKEEDWQCLSGANGQLHLKVPLCADASGRETVADGIDLTAYKDKKFYLAFHYNAIAASDADTYPRVDVTSLVVSKKLKDGSTSTMNDPKSQFGFNYAFEAITKKTNFSASNTTLLFQPTTDNLKSDVDVWAISQAIDLTAVSPDMGTPIKSLNMKTQSYTYTYNEPGEYTATFVGSNSNAWNSKSMVKEIKILVKENPVN